MGNKHQSGHNGQQHDHPHSGGKSAGSPLQQQASAQHRFEARDPSQSHSQDLPRGAQQTSQTLRSTPAQADRERSFTASVLETIKETINENPIPVALVGLGLGAGVTWLIMSNLKPPASPASRLVQRILQTAESRGRKIERSIEQLTPTTTLAISAAVLTVGAGITLAMLGSRDKSSWLSKGREQIVEIAQGFAHDAIERVEAIAKQVTDAYSERIHATA